MRGRHAGHARLRLQEGHLAEKGRGFQDRQGFLACGALLGDPHRATHHHVEAIPGIALPEEDLASLAGPPLSDDEDLGALRLVQVPEQGRLGQEGGVEQC